MIHDIGRNGCLYRFDRRQAHRGTQRRWMPMLALTLLAGFATLASTPAADESSEPPFPRLERLNPLGLNVPQGYAQVVTAEGAGRWVFLAGQGGIASDGTIPDDLAEQTRLMFDKVALALAAADASPADVVRIVLYILDLDVTDPSPVYAAVRAFFPADAKPASTVVGVSALARPGMLVEIDVTALAPAAAQRRARQVGDRQ